MQIDRGQDEGVPFHLSIAGILWYENPCSAAAPELKGHSKYLR